ncbi:Fc.00g088500.m01.CDS01 [Cosmosporella sp. VM-42]
MFDLRFPRPQSLVLLAVLRIGALAEEDAPAITTAPIFLPYYHEEAWSAVRGSVISINETARHTTYTIFCPDNDPPACDLSIADLECTLDGTTAATCSGYSSYKAGYNFHTGPTEASWTSTFSGSGVEWGVLTMAEKPKETDDSWDITAATAAWTTPATGSSGYVSIPQATSKEAAGVALGISWRLVVGMVIGVGLVVL